jgi:hypothetical protein
MITRELVKAEIDNVQESYLEVLYRIIKSLGDPREASTMSTSKISSDWAQFIEETNGCLADDPIERGEQGEYEVRETIE